MVCKINILHYNELTVKYLALINFKNTVSPFWHPRTSVYAYKENVEYMALT